MRTEYKIGLGILGLAAAIGTGFYVRKKIKMKRDIKRYETERYDRSGNKQKGPIVASETINLAALAQSIYSWLRLDRPWYDPAGAVEDDDQVERALLKLPPALYPQLVKVYNQKFNRDLTADLNKYLDGVENVRYLFA